VGGGAHPVDVVVLQVVLRGQVPELGHAGQGAGGADRARAGRVECDLRLHAACARPRRSGLSARAPARTRGPQAHARRLGRRAYATQQLLFVKLRQDGGRKACSAATTTGSGGGGVRGRCAPLMTMSWFPARRRAAPSALQPAHAAAGARAAVYCSAWHALTCVSHRRHTKFCHNAALAGCAHRRR